MNRCGACGKRSRKQYRAYVKDGPGRVAMRMVCPDCANDAIAVVVTNAQAALCSCGNGASVCGECAAKGRAVDHRELLAPAVRILKGLLKGLDLAREARAKMLGTKGDGMDGPSQYIEGKIEGLESAIHVLETEGQGRPVLVDGAGEGVSRA